MPLTDKDWECLDKLARFTFSRPTAAISPGVAAEITVAGFGKIDGRGDFVITAKGRRALRDRACSA